MTVSALSAAKTLCEMSGWTISNLELQKILYIAHMFHLGTSGGNPLVSETFEAWEYGPVLPAVYRKAKGFGSGAVRNVFHWEQSVPEDSSEYKMLNEALKTAKGKSPSQLVSITHWPKGAWYKSYRPHERCISIPNGLILEEFNSRVETLSVQKVAN